MLAAIILRIKKGDSLYIKILKILSVIVFLVGIAAFASTTSTSSQQITARSYQATYRTTTRVDGVTTKTSEFTRIVAENGEAKLTRPNGSTFITTNEGAVEVSPSATSLQYAGGVFSPESWAKMQSPAYLRSSEGFVREDSILGLTAYVIVDHTDDPSISVESWFVPDLGPFHAKRIARQGNEEIITELISIEFRPVAKSEVALPEGNVSFSHFEEQLNQRKATVSDESTERLEQQLEHA